MISIIIPIYNIESCLDKCLTSIVNQTYRDLEIILVNDGSTDSSLKICEKYKKDDTRITIITKPNGGLSDSRNCGLERAKGDYVLFIDGDDFLEENSCEKLNSMINGLDIDVVYGNCRWVFKDKIIEKHRKNFLNGFTCSGQEFFKKQLKEDIFYPQVWLGLYRREFLIKNNLFFKKGILHEDEEWTPRVLLLAQKVTYCEFIFYNYIIREGSITQKKDKTKNSIDIIETCYQLEKIYEELNDIELKRLVNQYLLKLYLSAVYMGYTYGAREKLIIRKQMLRGKSLCFKDRLRVLLFYININLYVSMHRLYLNEECEKNV